MNRFTVDDVLDHLEDAWQQAHSNRYATAERTRRDLAESIGCSYSTVNRLVKKALACNLIKERWTHQHQSYWEACYRLP